MTLTNRFRTVPVAGMLRRLFVLRLYAIAGQALAIIGVNFGLDIFLPLLPNCKLHDAGSAGYSHCVGRKVGCADQVDRIGQRAAKYQQPTGFKSEVQQRYDESVAAS